MSAEGRPPPEQIERFRALLLRERSEAEARIRERDARIPSTVRQDDETADFSDAGAAVAERDNLLAENDLDDELVQRVDRALERIDEGTYGISELSGKPIPTERLEAVPWATTLAEEEPPADR